MQLKTGQKAWKISKRRFSQTVRKHFATIENFAMCWQPNFALRNPIPQYTVALRNLPLTKPMRNFALPKFAMSSQCQIRNAKISQSQFRNAKANFAMPKSISQCQNTVHVSQPMRNFALRNSQPTLRISQTHFALPNSLPFAKFTFAGLVILCN